MFLCTPADVLDQISKRRMYELVPVIASLSVVIEVAFTEQLPKLFAAVEKGQFMFFNEPCISAVLI